MRFSEAQSPRAWFKQDAALLEQMAAANTGLQALDVIDRYRSAAEVLAQRELIAHLRRALSVEGARIDVPMLDAFEAAIVADAAASTRNPELS